MTNQEKILHTVNVYFDSSLVSIPHAEIKVFTKFHNDVARHKIINGHSMVEQELRLGKFDTLMIQVGDLGNRIKVQNQVRIEGIIIDGLDLSPHDVHLGRQYPDHTMTRHREPVRVYEPGTHFDFAGVYELDIETPIWKYALYAFSYLTPYRTSLYSSNKDVS
jgi:hypothetical protein